MAADQPSTSQEKKDHREDFQVALVIIGAGVVMGLMLLQHPASFSLWNTVVGIIFLCLLQAYVPRPASARALCAAYAATWASTVITIFGVLLEGLFVPPRGLSNFEGFPVNLFDLVLFVLWGVIFGIRFLSLTRPGRDRKASPSQIGAGAPEPNPTIGTN